MGKRSVIYKLERHKWPDEIASEKRRKRLVLGFIATGVVCFVLGIVSSGMIPRVSTTLTYGDEHLDLFHKAYSVMKNQWYFGKDVEDLEQELIEGAINGMMMSEIDLHTSYMTLDEATDFTDSLSGTLSGVGCSIFHVNDIFMVDKVYPSSPAEVGGLKTKDEIIAVDGVSVKGHTSDEVVSMVRGEEGTKVAITVLRNGEELTLKMTRAMVQATVYMKQIDEKTAVLTISSFADSTASEVATQLVKMEILGIENLIVDLRDDTGGYLSSLVSIGNYLLPKGTVIIQKSYRDGKINKDVSANKDPYAFSKIAVLVNGNTASAAEVLTAALQEGLGATVIGTTTYGKGTMQVPLVMGDGSILRYTTAEWLTTNGNTINGTGIEPDIYVENEDVYKNAVTLKEDDNFGYDSVSTYTVLTQEMLDYLGYSVDRQDGYFSKATETALKNFEKDHNLAVDGILDNATYQEIVAANFRNWFSKKEDHDLQMKKALEWIKQ